MKCDKPTGRKMAAGATVALCLLSSLLSSCRKSPGDPAVSPAGPPTQEEAQTKKEKPQTGEKEVETREDKKIVLTSLLAQRGWYQADGEGLGRQVQGLFEKADVEAKDDVIALILPHAGYRYSGQTAACGVKTAAGKYKRIVVIGPSHYVNMPGMLSVPVVTHYETPLGQIPLDVEFISKLRENKMFQNIPQAHQYEHSVQIELPLLQYTRRDFKLVPIVAGHCRQEQIDSAAGTLKQLVDSDTLVVASSDFTHYGPNYGYTPFREYVPEQLRKLDMGAYEYIAALDSRGFIEYKQRTGATICGYVPVAILLSMCGKTVEAELAQYTTSGELTGDFSNSVSYLSVAFHGKWQEKSKMNGQNKSEKLSGADKEQLLKLAKGTLQFYLRERKTPTPGELGVQVSPAMKRRGAAFVTLKRQGMLRGCIGDILPRGPLYESVIRNAVNAGVNDWRFPPVTSGEFAELSFEISALTVPEPIASADQIRIGTDGVILKKQGHSAVFLPQVAPEQGWDVDEMLTHLSLKAGLSGDAWKEGAEFLVFQADVFGENDR